MIKNLSNDNYNYKYTFEMTSYIIYNNNYRYKHCNACRKVNNQTTNQYPCNFKMYDNLNYMQKIYDETEEQSTERAIHQKDYQYYDRMENLLEDKKKKIAYNEYKKRREKINNAWIYSQDKNGNYYRYNTLTKVSNYI